MKNQRIRYEIFLQAMKVSLLQALMAIALVGVSIAGEGKNQELLDRTLSLSCQDQAVVTILKKIEKATDIRFLYSHELIGADRKVTFSVQKEKLSVVLNQLLSPLHLGYEISGRQIILKRLSSLLQTTPGEEILNSTHSSAFAAITGRVTSEEGEGLPGVNVVLKGTTNGTATSSDGSYSLDVPEGNGILVFSYIGFTTKEVAFNNQSVINVSLAADFKALSEVVVIGYGEKSRKMLTESIGTVEAKEIQRLPVASADAAIQGRVSGVQVTSVDGTPGSPVSVRIRGVGTVGNSQPLFVIDGIPIGSNESTLTNPLSTINPADIESMSVLKDASAAAVYGVRAANGVVLITTKRGKTGKPRIGFDGYYGVQNFPKTLNWNNTQQYVALTTEAINNANTQLNLQPGSEGYRTLPNDLLPGSPYLGVNTDWQDAVLNKNAPIQNYNVSVSGGNEAANYFVSMGYFKQSATIKKWDLERFSFRANSDYKIGKRFKFGQSLGLAYQNVMRGMNAGGDGFLYAGTANMPPFFRIYDDPANPIPGNRHGYNGNLNVAGLTIANQLGINDILQGEDYVTRILGGVYAQLEIINGLTIRSAASIDFSNTKNNSWQPGYSGPELGLDRSLNNYNDSRGEGYTQVFTNTLNYQKTFGDHTINALAGIEYQKVRSNGLSYGGFDYQSTDPAFYRSVKNQQGQEIEVEGKKMRVFSNAGSSLSNNAFVGYIGRMSYDYKQKYLLTATFRRDVVAQFAPERRFGNFPSFSAAWRISEEPFFDGITFFSDLKIRASWGQLGNSNIGITYPYVFRVSFTPDYGIGGTARQAPIQAIFPNRTVGWETVETTDFGFDASFFNNKLTLLATYYHRNTKDFLYSLPISSVAGFDVTSVNAGNVLNQGLELELGYNTNIGKDFRLNLSGNITTVKNRLTGLAPNLEEFASSENRTAVGYPIGYFYGYKTKGIYQTSDEAAAALPDKTAGNKPQPGDIIFEDNNGPSTAAERSTGKQFSGQPDGQIDANDRTYLGKTIPDFFYGLSIGADFKGFDLSILFQGVAGVQLYNEYRKNNEGLLAGGRNQLASTQNRWTGPNTSNTMPRAVANDFNQNARFSDRWVEDAGFLRLRNIQIGYSLPKKLLAKTKAFASARIYIAASNLLTITKYTGLDPEVTTHRSNSIRLEGNSSQLEAGRDAANIPQPRTFQAGFQFQF